MVHRELERQVDQAFAAGNNQQGLQLLRDLSVERPQDAEIWHRLSVVEEQIGSTENATAAHLNCLECSPGNPLAYFYAGYWYEQLGRTAEALSLYSLGTDIVELTLAPGDRGTQSPQTRIRFEAGDRALRTHLSGLHRRAVGVDAGNQRIADAIWTRSHDQVFRFSESEQMPQMFYIRGLSPVVEVDSLSWVKPLEAVAEDIRDEFLAALPRVAEQGRPYLPAETVAEAGFGSLVDSLDWTALDLFKDGERDESIAQYFPKTLSALSQIPLYGLFEWPSEVFFSILKAGQHIKPHYGLSNHSLTVHLPINVPENCWIIVKGKKHFWQEGEVYLFDDTFLHEAINNSTDERVVLIFSVWHPDLSDAERAAVKRSFQARHNWLAARDVSTLA
ncbi:MAG: aspartyl/asparaginyl beta-hydroxylase (cupin superfamily) [Halieaceae bacterium]|jgi:aspartyl/asparaginyl beta-hydroxylase (cupin superfamily)